MQPYVDILEPGNVASHSAATMFSSLDAQINDSHWNIRLIKLEISLSRRGSPSLRPYGVRLYRSTFQYQIHPACGSCVS